MFSLFVLTLAAQSHDWRPDARLKDSHGITALSAHEGHIVTLSLQPPFVTVYDTSGQMVRAWGRAGSGPGEIRFPKSLTIHEDSVVVLSLTPHQLVFFSMDGRHQQTRALRMPFVTRIASAGPFLYLQGGPFLAADQSLYRMDLQHIVTAESLYVPKKHPLELASGGRLHIRPPYAPRDHWVPLPGGGVVFVYQSTAEFQIKADAGVTKKKLVTHQRLIPEATRAWVRTQYEPYFSITNGKDLDQFMEHTVPKVFPQVIQLKTDPRGTVWLYRGDGPFGQVWEAYREGNLIRTLNIPIGWVVRLFLEDYIILLDQPDSDDALGLFKP